MRSVFARRWDGLMAMGLRDFTRGAKEILVLFVVIAVVIGLIFGLATVTGFVAVQAADFFNVTMYDTAGNERYPDTFSGYMHFGMVLMLPFSILLYILGCFIEFWQKWSRLTPKE